MLKRKALETEIARLRSRVDDLEERLCPCSQHEWVKTGSKMVFVGPEPETMYAYKCLRCGRVETHYPWEM